MVVALLDLSGASVPYFPALLPVAYLALIALTLPADALLPRYVVGSTAYLCHCLNVVTVHDLPIPAINGGVGSTGFLATGAVGSGGAIGSAK
jgi:hypothetical protein